MERHGRAMILARAMCCRLGTMLHELLATIDLEQWVDTPHPANTTQPKQSHISLIVPSGTGQAPEHPYSIHLHQAKHGSRTHKASGPTCEAVSLAQRVLAAAP